MRMIVAIIQPTKLSTVRETLADAGIDDVTVCDAMGYGRQRGQTASFRGNEYRVDLLRKVTLQIVLPDDQVESAVELICRTARTGSGGEIGDGKIFLMPVATGIDFAPTPETVSPGPR